MFYLHVCMYTTCVPGGHGGQKKTWDPLELELQVFVSGPVAAGNPNPPKGQPILESPEPFFFSPDLFLRFLVP